MRRFDAASQTLDSVDFVHGVTRDGLFARLAPVLVDAKTVVDLGCGTGKSIRPLAKQFRGAKIIGVDLSARMLDRCRARRYWLTKTSFLQADARELPLPDGSVDVVFCNLMLPWVDDLPAVAREVARVLRKDGLFAFATLGPDTFRALRRAWAEVDRYFHVPAFADMHDVGDWLSQSGLRDPVLDVDHLTVNYQDSDKLLRELTAAGARNTLRHRYPGLMTPARFAAFCDHLTRDGDIAVEFEIVYGHCWGSGARPATGDVRIDPGTIPIRRR